MDDSFKQTDDEQLRGEARAYEEHCGLGTVAQPYWRGYYEGTESGRVPYAVYFPDPPQREQDLINQVFLLSRHSCLEPKQQRQQS